MEQNNVKEICLAGGCFWGTEKFFKSIEGVILTKTGYANGKTENPTYEQVCYKSTGHAEAVNIQYDADIISLEELLEAYYCIIDPVAVNRQGADIGAQYRTGIYFSDALEEAVIKKSIKRLQKEFEEPIAIEVLPLKHFYMAEEYHQGYLDKNPGGYCHINFFQAEEKRKKRKLACVDVEKYTKKPVSQLKQQLTDIQFQVTQRNETEPPFLNEYNSHFQKGIYVDVTSGEPLFVSSDKFESGCGWPSFSKPIDPFTVQENDDLTHRMVRTEVRSRVGNAHLGHVFTDGPKERGGLRYCINSASLRFVALNEMEQQGYGELMYLIK